MHISISLTHPTPSPVQPLFPVPFETTNPPSFYASSLCAPSLSSASGFKSLFRLTPFAKLAFF
jgi:hypothetical protein